jgi:hypothetical protein
MGADSTTVIWSVVAVEAVSLFLLMTGVLLTRARRCGLRMRHTQALWRGDLPLAMSGQADALARIRRSLRSRGAWKAFHRLVIEYMGSDETRIDHASSLCHAVGLVEWLKKELLNARDPLDRVLAARTLARLRVKVSQDTIIRLLRSRERVLVIAAAYAAAASREPNQFLPVFRAIYERTMVTTHGAAEVLSAFDRYICPDVHRVLKEAAEDSCKFLALSSLASAGQRDNAAGRACSSAQVIMIELLALHDYRPAVPTLLQLAETTDDEEILEHVLSALEVLADRDMVPRLLQFLEHPKPMLRRESITALAALNAVGTTTTIRGLLDDPDPAVRAEAKKAVDRLSCSRFIRKDVVRQVSG